MKSIIKTVEVALVSIVISTLALHHSANASTAISCKEQFIKDFTVIPYFTNTTRSTIPAGTTINWKTFWAGTFTGNKTTVLSQPLAPGASVSTGIQFSGDNNSCTASF